MQASVVGLGCWAIGGTFWGPQDDADSLAAIQKAIDLGMNFIDTAPAYGCGHSEEIVGRAMKGRRDQVFLATKTGLAWDENRKIYNDNSRAHVLRTVDESLRRLQTDHIDLHQVHWPDPKVPIEETMQAMREIWEAGKIRAIGVSNFDVNLMKQAMQVAPIHSLQPPYSMLDRRIEAEILPFCRENGIGIVSYGSLARGLLTGKFKGDETFDDLRKDDPMFQGERFKKNVQLVDELKPIAANYGKSVGALAIRWTVQQPGITLAICGGRNAEQVEQNAEGADWQLSDEDVQRVTALIDQYAG
jgi:aryl-alcohol dehydrogenase-like predicted oxidoreductase